MKRVISIVILTICLVFSLVLTACSTTPQEHEHTYSVEWTYNKDYHWHQATCSHTALKTDKGAHEFESVKVEVATYDSAEITTYRCTKCSYEKTEQTAPKLEHTFADTLTHENGTTHWYACLDAGYESLKKGEEQHNLIKGELDSSTGYITYSCVCGFTTQKLECVILSMPTISAEKVYIGQTLSSVSFTGGQGSVDGNFVWSNPSQVITGSGNFNITFVPQDSQYASITQSVYINAEQLTVTVSSQGNGSVNYNGIINVNYGQDLTLTFTPNQGYKVNTILVDYLSVAVSNSYTFTNITSNHILSVEFVEEIIESTLPFELTCVSGTQNAYVYQDGVLTFTTISEQTVYSIAGEFNGSIVFDVGDTYKFDLEMCGFTLTSQTVNPITALSGNEISLTAKNGYTNYIYDKRAPIDATDTTLYSGAIYSLVDLEICGKGSLTLISDNNNGIHTKDDLQVKNLELYVKCKDNALKGNDSVSITLANTTLIASQGDCIKTTNSHINATTLKQKGTISIAGGTHNLYAACDGIDASYNVLIDDATTVLNVYTDKYSEYSEEITATTAGTYYLRYNSTNYKYSVKYYNSDTDYLWVNVSDTYETVSSSSNRPGQSSTYYYYNFAKNDNYTKLAVYMYSSSQTQGQDTSYYACSDYVTVNASYDTVALSYRSSKLSVSWTNYSTTSTGGGMGGMGGMQEGNSDKGTYSTKGIKAENEITINLGTIFIKAYDDAIHSTNSGIALENGEMPTGNLTINGGTLTLYSNDDGVHADGVLTVNNGDVNVTNAYEGVEGSSIVINGGNLSVVSLDDGFNSTITSGAGITIAGGNVYVNASGDGLDSNSSTSKGAIIFSGGKVVVISTSNGNAAIDSDGGYTHSGGTVLALMPTGGMTNECTNGNSTGMTTKSSLSVSSGGYVTVSANSTLAVTVKVNTSSSMFAVYLGASNATISSSTTTSASLNSNGVCWNV